MTAVVPELRRLVRAYGTDAGGVVPAKADDLVAVLDAAEALAVGLADAEARIDSEWGLPSDPPYLNPALARWRELTGEAD